MVTSDTAHTIHPQTRIGHIHLTVADLQRALTFYRDLLGFTVTMWAGDSAVFLSAGGYHCIVFPVKCCDTVCYIQTCGSHGNGDSLTLVMSLSRASAGAVNAGADQSRPSRARLLQPA